MKERIGHVGKTYAEAAKATKKSRKSKITKERDKAKMAAPPTDTEVLQVDPLKASETRDDIWEKLKAVQTNPRTQIIKSRDSSQLIFVPDDGDTTKSIKEIVPLVKKRTAKRPRLIMYDVPRSYEEGDITENIRRQIPDFGLSFEELNSISFVYRTGPRNADTVHWVTDVCPSAYSKLNSQRAYIGNRRCKIKEHDIVTQCYRCQSFGHTLVKCRAPKDLCRECASEHDSKNCKVQAKKCANCKGPHNATYAGCPRREAVLCGLLRSDDFGSINNKQ